MLSAFKNYFTITKKEWNGMLLLAVIILVVLIAPNVYQHFKQPEKFDFTRIKEAQKILAQATEDQPENNFKSYKGNHLDDASFSTIKSKPAYFAFNPNQLSNKLWEKLGLSERQISLIKNYEAKGGKFYKKEDLQKIYSVTAADYTRLAPYIAIPERSFGGKSPTFGSIKYKSKPMIAVDINQADSAQLTEINGIGPAFANRILKYRNRLGGFNKKTQLLEIFGLDSAKYAAIENQVLVDASAITKININTCDFEDLKRNPYLTFKQMNLIIQYRKQHGNYNSIKDLKNIVILNDEVLKNIEPYIIFK